MKQFNDIQKLYKDKITEAKNRYKLTENKYLLLKEGNRNEKKIGKRLMKLKKL